MPSYWLGVLECYLKLKTVVRITKDMKNKAISSLKQYCMHCFVVLSNHVKYVIVLIHLFYTQLCAMQLCIFAFSVILIMFIHCILFTVRSF